MTAEQIITDILKREGWPTVTDRAADRGGLSKGPIRHQTLREWRHPRPVSRQDLIDMEEPEARDILRTTYAKPYDWIHYEPLRVLCIDLAVTSWHDDVAKALQEASGAAVDGVLGVKTKTAVLKCSPVTLHLGVWKYRQKKFLREAFDAEVLQFLKDNPSTQLHNLRGWLNRNLELL